MFQKAIKSMPFILKWILICGMIGIFSGFFSGFFLISLEWVTQIRNHYRSIIFLLPLAGFCIGFGYHYYGQSIVKGNNLLLEEYQHPKKIISFKMAPFVLISTLLTHLFGGSAGREGTAVQMGGAIADQFTNIFGLNNTDRQSVLVMGISAGFASVFGTPLAGAVFAIEILYCSSVTLKTIILSFLVAFIASYTVEILQVEHTHYAISEIPVMTPSILLYLILASLLFGFAALVFSRSTRFWGQLFTKKIQYPPLRPFVGGLVLVIIIFSFDVQKFIGLGVPTIIESFQNPSQNFDFLLKTLFTGFTLGCGFKGGEVTPLFFIGATLGSALSTMIPLPIALLAGMGFVAVFSGATHTPVACTIMGLELFGIDAGIYIALACTTAYFSSGTVGIYSSQNSKGVKYYFYKKCKQLKF